MKRSWVRQESASGLRAEYINGTTGHKHIPTWDEVIGYVTVVDYPAYDNGHYYVIDTVKDIQWTVMSYQCSIMRQGIINKYEAIEYADDLKAADERAGY